MQNDVIQNPLFDHSSIEGDDLFENFFNLPLVGSAITSRQKGWIAVNDRTCEILGYDREELFKKTWADITYPDDLQADVELFQKMLAGEINGYSLEKRFVRPDGTIVWTILSGGRSCKAGPGSEYFYVQILDITQRKKAEIELINARNQAEAARISLEIAHRKLGEYAKQQIELTRLEEREQLLQDMHDGFGSQLAALRISAQRGTIKPSEFERALTELYADLHLIVDTLSYKYASLSDALLDMRHRLMRHYSSHLAHLNWTIKLEGVPTLPSRSVLHILRIIQEALNNALRHAQASEISIKAYYAPDASLLSVIVSDNGIGFLADQSYGRGLVNMKQRAREIGASLSITRDSPSGTKAELSLAFKEKPPEEAV